MPNNKFASTTDLYAATPPDPRLNLVGADRRTLAGTDRLALSDTTASYPVYVGMPKTPLTSFIIQSGFFHLVFIRLTLTGSQRATLQGSASLVLSDDGVGRSRIVLTGRGF